MELSWAMTVLVTSFVCVEPTGENKPPVGLICWTCNKTDNQACNNWAPNKPCPVGYNMCKTTHRFNTQSGSSISVRKQCSTSRDCTGYDVGCYRIAYLAYTSECTSCCDYPYCNEDVPRNETSARALSTIGLTNSALLSPVSSMHVIVVCLIVITLTSSLPRCNVITSSTTCRQSVTSSVDVSNDVSNDVRFNNRVGSRLNHFLSTTDKVT